MADDPQVYTNCYIAVEIKDLDGVGGSSDMPKLLFNSFTPPAWSTEAPKHKFYGDSGKTETLHGGARNENWSPARSTVLQVLVSLMGLVLVKEPYYSMFFLCISPYAFLSSLFLSPPKFYSDHLAGPLYWADS